MVAAEQQSEPEHPPPARSGIELRTARTRPGPRSSAQAAPGDGIGGGWFHDSSGVLGRPITDKLDIHKSGNQADFRSTAQKGANRFAAAGAIIDGPVVDVHPDEPVGQDRVEVAGKAGRAVQRLGGVLQGVGTMLSLQKPGNPVDQVVGPGPCGRCSRPGATEDPSGRATTGPSIDPLCAGLGRRSRAGPRRMIRPASGRVRTSYEFP